jgi:Protein of unknown function (DUF3667)
MATVKTIQAPETNCLNCEAPLTGKFCSACGQKANLHKDNFWHMTAHFAGDYFHYDNKFWSTVKVLFIKPGKITAEYNLGKRAKYLNPIQFYFFVTTVFFLLFFSFSSHNNEHIKIKTQSNKPIIDFKFNDDPIADSIIHENENVKVDGKIGIGKWTPKEQNLAEYDSVQASLPSAQKDNYLVHRMRRQVFKMQSSNDDGAKFTEIFLETYYHSFPKVFFFLLPFFALLLKIFFRKSKLLYVDHIIFSIHFHSFCFLLFLVFGLFLKLVPDKFTPNNCGAFNVIGIGIYLAFALKMVYNNTWVKTLIKQMILFVLYMFGFALVALGFAMFTFLTM